MSLRMKVVNSHTFFDCLFFDFFDSFVFFFIFFIFFFLWSVFS